MVKLPTLLLGTTLGITALGLSATASAGVAVGVGIGLPVPAPAVVAAVPEPVAYEPGRYYGPHFYARVPYHAPYFGPAYAHPRVPVGGWHPGFAARGGYWRR